MPPARPVPLDKTTKTLPRHPFFNTMVLSKIYNTPLLVLGWAIYGVAPLYYLLHYSPLRNTKDERRDGLSNPFVKWTLCIMIQYIAAVITVSWAGRYQVRKNRAVFLLMGIGLFALLAGGFG